MTSNNTEEPIISWIPIPYSTPKWKETTKTSKLEKFESTGQCCQGETGQHSSISSEDLEVSPGCRQRLLPDIRQRFSTTCHSVSPWRPARRGWTTDHGDEMRSKWVSSSARTARGTDRNSRMLPSIGRRCPTAYSATCQVASHRHSMPTDSTMEHRDCRGRCRRHHQRRRIGITVL